MKITGIIFAMLGGIGIFFSLIAAANGYETNFGAFMPLVLGIFLISRANKKKEEEEKKKQWEQECANNNTI